MGYHRYTYRGVGLFGYDWYTHVLVNSPDTGYGIFIENMLDAAS
ncbi:MAG: hypothetical protein E7431_07355 [Ruminococcaceae bacterium]|nr:hypothetical protein [Oscillospiraceae bacterium]